jgi:hypothetical protein
LVTQTEQLDALLTEKSRDLASKDDLIEELKAQVNARKGTLDGVSSNLAGAMKQVSRLDDLKRCESFAD